MSEHAFRRQFLLHNIHWKWINNYSYSNIWQIKSVLDKSEFLFLKMTVSTKSSFFWQIVYRVRCLYFSLSFGLLQPLYFLVTQIFFLFNHVECGLFNAINRMIWEKNTHIHTHSHSCSKYKNEHSISSNSVYWCWTSLITAPAVHGLHVDVASKWTKIRWY